jgi:leucyl aminopeptidase (aminopeptidase T)
MRALARSALSKNLRLRRGENLIVESWTETVGWANAFVLEARRLHARPMLLFQDEATFWKTVEEVPAAEIGRVGSHEWAALKATDAYVFLYGPADTQREDSLPQGKLRELTAYEDEWFRIVEKERVRTIRFDLGRTNASAARQFGLGLDAWRKELVEATLVDTERMRRDGLKVARALEGGRSLRLVHSNGTDLELGLKGRRPRVHDGVIDERDVKLGDIFENLPSGWVAAAVDERVAEGRLVGNTQVSVSSMGHGFDDTGPAEGVEWEFHGGRLDSFRYAQGGEEFRKVYNRMGPGRERPGAVSVGLNPRIRNLPRMDDQRRGRVTLAIGRNTYLDGTTHTPYFAGFVHLDGGDLWVDGKPVLRSGEIV